MFLSARETVPCAHYTLNEKCGEYGWGSYAEAEVTFSKGLRSPPDIRAVWKLEEPVSIL